MKLIKLHNGTWIDAHDVESIVPTRGGMETAYNKIYMKSGKKLRLHPQNGHRSWSDRRDLMPDVLKEADELAERILINK